MRSRRSKRTQPGISAARLPPTGAPSSPAPSRLRKAVRLSPGPRLARLHRRRLQRVVAGPPSGGTEFPARPLCALCREARAPATSALAWAPRTSHAGASVPPGRSSGARRSRSESSASFLGRPLPLLPASSPAGARGPRDTGVPDVCLLPLLESRQLSA